MERKKIKKENVRSWLDKIAEDYELIAPVRRNVIQFAEVASGDEAILDFTNSVIPPKNLFLPQTEHLFTFRREAGETELKPERESARKRVIFGIRQCDVQSLLLLDRVFGGEFRDSYYLARREKTILIGLACTNPQTTCFCASFDIDPLSPEGTDILLTDLGQEHLVDVSTKRGVDLVSRSPQLFSHASEKDGEKSLELKGQVLNRIGTIPTQGIGERLGSMWEDRIWSDLAEVCVGCGICTYLCPTCHCFDIQDEDWGREGMRFRCWDSCIFSEFTLMASGENPRPTKRERLRQRFFHKFKYFPEKYGVVACVGCGRCISKCPVNLDVTQTLGKLKAEG